MFSEILTSSNIKLFCLSDIRRRIYSHCPWINDGSILCSLDASNSSCAARLPLNTVHYEMIRMPLRFLHLNRSNFFRVCALHVKGQRKIADAAFLESDSVVGFATC
ncbi:hypothetical protein Ahy_A02g009516 isoform A [Arachis hypogaea]|uniref:Uncharacterized protein n=1 Tax=Arachis hypogaea TaxID=3818 RepID=A0A445EHB5_ARAHY|nr:hypothetical protein Ahy_A02g009516 isoform A [Arachis hypogaea]